jgi:hypothetical protein
MQRYRDRLPVVAAALLVAATILFVIGTTMERPQARTDEQQATSTVERPAGEAGEHNEATEGQSNATTEGTGEHRSSGESSEELFGINPESAGLTAVVAAVSLLLAILLIVRPRRELLMVVVVVGLGFAAPDVREGIHQASESNAGLLAIALVTGLLHLAVAVTAAAGLRPQRVTAMTS